MVVIPLIAQFILDLYDAYTQTNVYLICTVKHAHAHTRIYCFDLMMNIPVNLSFSVCYWLYNIKILQYYNTWKQTLSRGAGWKLNTGVLLKETDSWINCRTFLSLVTWRYSNQSMLTRSKQILSFSRPPNQHASMHGNAGTVWVWVNTIPVFSSVTVVTSQK